MVDEAAKPQNQDAQGFWSGGATTDDINNTLQNIARQIGLQNSATGTTTLNNLTVGGTIVVSTLTNAANDAAAAAAGVAIGQFYRTGSAVMVRVS